MAGGLLIQSPYTTKKKKVYDILTFSKSKNTLDILDALLNMCMYLHAKVITRDIFWKKKDVYVLHNYDW